MYGINIYYVIYGIYSIYGIFTIVVTAVKPQLNSLTRKMINIEKWLNLTNTLIM